MGKWQTMRERRSTTGILAGTGKSPLSRFCLFVGRVHRELDDFFLKQGYNTRDMEFDLIYVNGDNNLENLKRPDETWKVRLIEGIVAGEGETKITPCP